MRRGLSPEEASREARLRLGNVASLREEHRETRGLPFLDTLLQDLRYTFRILRRDTRFCSLRNSDRRSRDRRQCNRLQRT